MGDHIDKLMRKLRRDINKKYPAKDVAYDPDRCMITLEWSSRVDEHGDTYTYALLVYPDWSGDFKFEFMDVDENGGVEPVISVNAYTLKDGLDLLLKEAVDWAKYHRVEAGRWDSLAEKVAVEKSRKAANPVKGSVDPVTPM